MLGTYQLVRWFWRETMVEERKLSLDETATSLRARVFDQMNTTISESYLVVHPKNKQKKTQNKGDKLKQCYKKKKSGRFRFFIK